MSAANPHSGREAFTRRVVITGLGMVSPLADGVEPSWKRLLNGRSAVRRIEGFDVDDIPCKIGAQVPTEHDEHAFIADDYMSAKDQRRTGKFIMFGMAAAKQAIEDSGWSPDGEACLRTGVLLGSGIGGLNEISRGTHIVDEGVRKLSPFFIPASLINLISGQVSIQYGFQGPNHAIATADATGTNAIGDAARLIQWGDADVMIAGAAEAICCRQGLAGFSRTKALSTHFNDDPQAASRPWDRARDGFVLGEGAGVVVLEELEHAKARGAQIYGEIVGYGITGDADPSTTPTSVGAERCMRAALKKAHLNPNDLGYINAHGTSSAADSIELAAVQNVLGDAVSSVPMSSTKSAIGHLWGAGGALETIFALLAIRDNVVPPTLNLDNPEDTTMDLVAHEAQERKVDAAMTNSFGFGGANASLIVQRF
ncbi:beta-ketoacyl-ACP synthase II [Magnetovibrio sp. PR-2]|uniref:beta-ketoacyl-ACP synthase II n=1 Tax=Magnetovibrio sp. PR-2 TaxID=3120356 RepID=UPI002FCE394A